MGRSEPSRLSTTDFHGRSDRKSMLGAGPPSMASPSRTLLLSVMGTTVTSRSAVVGLHRAIAADRSEREPTDRPVTLGDPPAQGPNSSHCGPYGCV